MDLKDRLERLEERMRRIEERMDRIEARLGLPPLPDADGASEIDSEIAVLRREIRGSTDTPSDGPAPKRPTRH